MSAVWWVKCNVSTMILRKAHDNLTWCIRERGNTARQWSKVGFDRPGRRTSESHRACASSQLLVRQEDDEKVAFDASEALPYPFVHRILRPPRGPEGGDAWR
jgi:hypothetical protein